MAYWNTNFVRALMILITLASCVRAVSAQEILPIVSATGGAVPIDHVGWNFWDWGSDLDTSSLIDGNPLTGITLWGLDNTVQSNGVAADTSAFALFKFVVPISAPAIRFTVRDEAHGTPLLSKVSIDVWRPDLDSWVQGRYRDSAATPTTFSLTFSPLGNDGVYSTPTDIWNTNLNNIQSATHEVIFVVYDGAALNQPGQYRLDLYEVSLTVVPEPTIEMLLSMLGIAALLKRPSFYDRHKPEARSA